MNVDTISPSRPKVTTALHGPAHPEAFRVQVGRFGARHYYDPLPADDKWEESDDAWPAVSTVKKAADKDWSWVSLQRAAHYLAERRDELDGLNADEIHARLNEINKAGLNRAAGRGTSIHQLIEAQLAGQPTLPGVVPEAEPYLPVIDRMLTELQPVMRYSEIVAISRIGGYGGTLDAVIEIGGRSYLVDWKTRKAGKHGCYDEEAWQAAAYLGADYWIVEENDRACRVDVPDVDGALIVSIDPSSYRLYPIDLDQARPGWVALLDLWKAKRNTTHGKPVRLAAQPPTPGQPTAEPEPVPVEVVSVTPAPESDPSRNRGREDLLDYTRARAKELADAGHRERLIAIWAEEGLPSIHPDAPPVTSTQLQVIATVLTEIEHDINRWVSDDEIAGLRTLYAELTDGQRAAFDQWMVRNKWNPAHRLTHDRASAVALTIQELRSARAA